MFTFTYRFSIGVLLVISLVVVAWVGIGRKVQVAYPPVLYSETTNLSLYTTTIGCGSFWAGCKRTERFLLADMASFPLAEWSPDGHYIAAHLSKGWFIYPKDCLLVLRTCDPVLIKPALQDTRLAWGPDGTTIASYASTRSVTTTIQTMGCWQLDSPCIEKKIPLTDSYFLSELTWSGDGSRMAFSDYVQTGLVWLDTACFDKPEGCGNDLQIVPGGVNRVSWPSLSKDGRKALVVMDTANNNTMQQLFMLDLDSGSAQQITFRAGTAEYPDWSADERYVLFSGFATARSSDLIVYLMDLERHITLPLMVHEGRDLTFPTWGHVPTVKPPES